MIDPAVFRKGSLRARNVRLPDFIVIGAMKSGTTTLFEWLADQPEFALPALKEPNFFSDDRQWRKGLGWYGGLFADAPPDCLVGEASVRYTGASLSAIAAERMAATVPHARLIYLVRHPIDRIRSQYRHWAIVMRGSKTLVEALNKPDNELVGRSLYYQCVA
ncbi:MAG: sulfotransferase domain-containing protein, partial [Gemmatimonadetes bacterium]|nr:sulfotransferase domain-containing protein [Gemmatimonadota bacterium]